MVLLTGAWNIWTANGVAKKRHRQKRGKTAGASDRPAGEHRLCHAVNLGIREARSPYVILLNNDTRVEAGFVKGLYDAIRKDEKDLFRQRQNAYVG